MMEQIEKNVIKSFDLAKRDIMRLSFDTQCLSQTQDQIMQMIDEMKASNSALARKVRELEFKLTRKQPSRAPKVKKIVKTVTKTVSKRPKKVYVSAKNSKKFHLETCPFAQNIQPKNKVKLNSKTKALNMGLKPCKCVQ